ncbi:hypothetical protein ABKN59_000006 [Abortiporus biennis]
MNGRRREVVCFPPSFKNTNLATNSGRRPSPPGEKQACKSQTALQVPCSPSSRGTGHSAFLHLPPSVILVRSNGETPIKFSHVLNSSFALLELAYLILSSESLVSFFLLCFCNTIQTQTCHTGLERMQLTQFFCNILSEIECPSKRLVIQLDWTVACTGKLQASKLAIEQVYP